VYELMGEPEAKLGSAGTVANGGLRLAAWMGCDPIVSVGRDLAMDGQRYYADASVDGGAPPVMSEEGGKISFAGNTNKLRLAEGEDLETVRKMLQQQEYRLCTVPGFFGEPVTTTDLFVYELGLVQSTLRELAGQARFINATEGGAHLQGMEHMTLQAFIDGDTRPAMDIQGLLAGAVAGHDSSGRRRKLHAALTELLRDLKKVVQLAARAEALAQATGSGEREYRRVRGALAERSRARLMISVLVQGAISDLMSPGADEPAARQPEVGAQERALYRAIQVNIGAICTGIEQQLPLLAAGLAALPTS
jgi:hypothetical protein